MLMGVHSDVRIIKRSRVTNYTAVLKGLRSACEACILHPAKASAYWRCNRLHLLSPLFRLSHLYRHSCLSLDLYLCFENSTGQAERHLATKDLDSFRVLYLENSVCFAASLANPQH